LQDSEIDSAATQTPESLAIQVGRLELLRRGTKILTSTHLSDGACLYWKASAVRLVPENADDKINVDGEVLPGETIELKVMPSALKVFVAFDDQANKGGGGVENMLWMDI